MKAAIFVEKEHFEIREVKRPKCNRGEVLVRVKACAVCGTDLRIFRGQKRIDVPITGHEISGVIEEGGEGVEGLSIGDKVIVETVVGCGECDACRSGEENRCRRKFKAIGYQYNGGFAQFLLVPRNAVRQGCVIKIPDHVTFEEATVVEPFSCVINGWAPFKERTELYNSRDRSRDNRHASCRVRKTERRQGHTDKSNCTEVNLGPEDRLTGRRIRR